MFAVRCVARLYKKAYQLVYVLSIPPENKATSIMACGFALWIWEAESGHKL